MADISHEQPDTSSGRMRGLGGRDICWCRWCGHDLPDNCPRLHCGVRCAIDELADARKRKAPRKERERLREIIRAYRRRAASP